MPEYIDVFEITGTKGLGDFDFGHREDSVNRELMSQHEEGTNSLKRAHASLLYNATPDEDQMHQFHKDFFRSRKIKIDGVVHYDASDLKKNTETIKQDMANAFQVEDPKQTTVLRGLQQALSGDLMTFMSKNYTLQDAEGTEVQGTFALPHDLFDIEYEKRGNEYSYKLRSPVYFLIDPEHGSVYARNKEGKIVPVDFQAMKDPDFATKYMPITNFEITATLDARKEPKPHCATFRVLIESDPPTLRYQGPKKDLHTAISVEQVKKVPLSEARTELNALANDLRKTFIQESDRTVGSKQPEYLSRLSAILKTPAFRNCVDLKNLAKEDAPALRDAAEALNRLLENNIQAKPSRLRRITNALRITTPDPLVTFQKALSSLIKGMPLSLPEKVAPKHASTIEATVSEESNKAAAPKKATPTTVSHVIEDIKQNLQTMEAEQHREVPKSKKETQMPGKLKTVFPAVTEEQHGKHQKLMVELQQRKRKGGDAKAPTSDLRKTPASTQELPESESRKKPTPPPRKPKPPGGYPT